MNRSPVLPAMAGQLPNFFLLAAGICGANYFTNGLLLMTLNPWEFLKRIIGPPTTFASATRLAIRRRSIEAIEGLAASRATAQLCDSN